MPASRQSRRDNNAAYYERRERLYALVRRDGFGYCAGWARELDWASSEARSKLMSLRADGLVYYDEGEWHEEEE